MHASKLNAPTGSVEPTEVEKPIALNMTTKTVGSIEEDDHNKISEPIKAPNPVFVTVPLLPEYEPAFTVGGLRHLLFVKGQELEAEGITCRFGRRLVINLPRFREYVATGRAAVIARKK